MILVGWCAVVKYGAVIDGAFPGAGLFVAGVWWAAPLVGVMIVGEWVVGLRVVFFPNQLLYRLDRWKHVRDPVPFCVDGLFLGDAASFQPPSVFFLG